jgi:SAM-dependent methyltransferase
MWADWYLPAALPALENLFFSRILPGGRVLDLCCGSGHVTRELLARGYRVTGLDSSPALIELARLELPGAEFCVGDARKIEREEQFEGVLSTFDSLNHLLSIEELQETFTGVHRALVPHGLFIFDMNLEEAYGLDLRQWTVKAEEDSVGLVRGAYDAATKIATTELIWFVRSARDCWVKHSSEVRQRCYTQQEIVDALREAGFGEIEAVPANQAGIQSDLGYGRIFFVARA